MTERCKFCGRKLDDKNRCQHKNCADYQRTLILEANEKNLSEKSEGKNYETKRTL